MSTASAEGRARVDEPQVTKISANLPNGVVEDLRNIATSEAITMTQALRNAIALYKYVSGEMRTGGKLLVERPDGHIREVIPRW